MNRQLMGQDRISQRARLIDNLSLEITAKDLPSLRGASASILPATPVSVTFLPGETMEARVDAAMEIRRLGFQPVPHFAARRFRDAGAFEAFLQQLVDRANVDQCFVIAGDSAVPDGPFPDSLSLLRTGAFERAGIRSVGLGGYPEGNLHMSVEQCTAVLQAKCSEIEERGMRPFIVTQFAFDADPVANWVARIRDAGIVHAIRLGVPGPSGVKTLVRFAARCGVGASASVLAKYGISLTRLMGTAGPDKFVAALSEHLDSHYGDVGLHLYPFGGIERAVDWVMDFKSRS